MMFLFPGLLLSNASASGSSSFFSTVGNQGYVESATTAFVDGELVGSFGLSIYRMFLSFNTLLIPDSAVIQSAILHVYYESDISVTNFNVRVFDTDYITFDNSLWTPTGSFQGNVFSSSSPDLTWYSLSLDPSTISSTGNSTFMLNSSDESFGVFSHSALIDMSSNRPILDVVYTSATPSSRVDIELKDHSWLNGTAFPDIQFYNYTYDLWKFEIDSVPNVNNITIEKSVAGSQFMGITPSCTVIENSTALILNGTFASITYRVWLIVPAGGGFNIAYISLYDINTGRGIQWGTYMVRMSEGLRYNQTSGYNIFFQDQTVTASHNYTIQVLDYFGRVMMNYSFVSTSNNQAVSVPIASYNWKMTNQRDHFSLLTIYYGYYPSVYNYSLFVEPHGTESINLQVGNYSFRAQTYYNDGTTGSTEWFNRSINASGFIILEGTTWVDVNIYNGFTGLGMSWELFNCTYQIAGEPKEIATDSMVPAKFDHNLTIIVRDFFNRELFNGTRNITGNTTSWNIPVYVYSVKIYNERDNFTMLRIWYGGWTLGHPPYAEFLEPQGGTNLFLLGGYYTFCLTVYNVTGLNASDVVSHAYWWNQTINSIKFFYLNGYSITMLSGGLYSLQTSSAQGFLDILMSNTGLGLTLNATQTSILWSLVNSSAWSNMTGIQVMNLLNLTEAQLTGLIINSTGNMSSNLTILISFVSPRIHLSYYNGFTGIGIAPYEFNVSASVNGSAYQRIQTDLANGILYKNVSIIVRDFFGRILYNQSKNIITIDFYWDIPLYVYNYKFYNQKDFFTKVWIWYNYSVAPYSEYLSPKETIEFFLLPGNYIFAMTVFDNNGITGLTYYWSRVVADAGYVILDGVTITEVLTTATGIKATQKVITDILTPDIVMIGYNMPSAPAFIGYFTNSTNMRMEYVIQTNTYQTKSGAYLWFNSTEPDVNEVTTMVTFSDSFLFTGNVSTTMYINETNASTVYSATTLPSSVSLTGSSYTIWANRTVSVTRMCGFRYSQAFTYHYFSNDTYQADITFKNPSETSWRDLYLFVPFQNMSNVDNESLSVYDINNTIPLSQGTNFVQSRTGVHLWFPSLTNDTWRGFRIQYTSTNQNETPTPTITVTQIGDGNSMTYNWQGIPYYFSDASWINTYRRAYHGGIYIRMQTNPLPDPTSVIVMTENGLILIQATVNGNTIYIPDMTVATGAKIQFRVLFQAMSPSIGTTNEQVLTIFGVIAVTGLILCVLFVRINPKGTTEAQKKRYEQFGMIFLGVSVLFAIATILYLLFTATGKLSGG